MEVDSFAITLLKLKGMLPGRTECDAEIVISDAQGDSIGSLTVLDRDMASNDAILDMLTNWRNTHRGCFLSQFTSTPERTRAWLLTVVLPAEDRVLFLVRNVTGDPIGNIGLNNISTISAELDNVLRGEPATHKTFMASATRALLRWAREQLGITQICLHVYSDNYRAICLYEAVGFTRAGEQGLIRTAIGDEVHITPTRLPVRPGEVGLLEMTFVNLD